MGMQTDVLSVSATATGELVPARTRVRGISVTPGTAAGTFSLLDGGATGRTAIGPVVTNANAPSFYIDIPGEGVLFTSDVYVTISNVSITIFYG
jgi:hypothetical protein